jgi:AraC-like DNA-binding protein
MIPEPGQTSLNFVSFIILLGVVQGIILTIAGILKRGRKAKLKAVLFFSITCLIAEIFLNRTGYMYYVIWLVDFSEPVQFAIPPLIYLITISLDSQQKIEKAWLHFLPFFGYLLYFIPFYFAPNSYKLETYYFMHHFVEWQSNENFEFLGMLGKFRLFQMQLCFFQTIVYLVISFQLLVKYKNESSLHATVDQTEAKWWFAFNAAITFLIALVLIVKVTFVRDIGDHIIASFFTLIIYFVSITELLNPFRTVHAMNSPGGSVNTQKYVSSGLKDEKKEEILQKLAAIMQNKKLYADNLISLAKLAKQVDEPAYMVSQVINEKMEISFYDWIARYRVEEAKKLMTDPKTERYTIEQIAEEVGYNSKSAFNKAFKKFTGKTPTEYKFS